MTKDPECCPTCGRVLVTKTQPPFREKLLRYCDGTRTMAEVIKLTGSTYGSIHVAMIALRDQGHPVKVKREEPPAKKLLTREEFDYLTMLRAEEGLSWREIGLLQQLSEAGVWGAYRKAIAVYGEPPPRVIKKKPMPATLPATTSACTS